VSGKEGRAVEGDERHALRKFVSPWVAKIRWGWMKPLYWAWRRTFLVEAADCDDVEGRHLAPYVALLRFVQASRSVGVDFYLDRGVLLGAVRQRSFAGRPSDVDIGVVADAELLEALERGLRKYLWIKSIRRVDATRVHFDVQPGPEWLPSFMPSWSRPQPVTIDVFHGKVELCPLCRGLHTAMIYDLELPIPANFSAVLSSMYGADWNVANAQQWGVDLPVVGNCQSER